MQPIAYNSSRRRMRVEPLSPEEFKKFDDWADQLEGEQRTRFNSSADPFFFFESEFERRVRSDIKQIREMLQAELERGKSCCCDD